MPYLPNDHCLVCTAKRSEHEPKGTVLLLAKGEQIHVSGRPVWCIIPESVEHGALQQESRPSFGLADPVQQPFQSIAGQYQIEGFGFLPG